MSATERLMVLRYPKKPQYAFHPRLTLQSTGFFPPGQWCGVMFKPGITVGLCTIHESPTIEKAVAHYLSELKRCQHAEVKHGA
jgi:hypothetical protein